MLKECVVCKKGLTGRQSKFCSANCKAKEWAARNPEKRKSAVRQWRLNNWERYKEIRGRAVKAWELRNPEKHKEYNARYYAERTAAVRLVRELEEKGIEALL